MKLTDREVELIQGMIEVQSHHADRCLSMTNPVAIKQREWDLERVALLQRVLEEKE